jgi:AcrR family transcriptional regulator
MSEVKKSKILTAARSVFLRYGYKRVSMSDIAEAAAVSRPALYVLFKNKEEIFISVFLQWVDETVTALQKEMAKLEAPEQQLMCAFELWTVQSFEMMRSSPEAKELLECGFEFAQDSLKQGYKMFEAAIAPVVARLAERHPPSTRMAPERIAHVLASAALGFKQTAVKAVELRLLIENLLVLAFGLGEDAFPKHGRMRRRA